jgi:hypothetical protein
LFEDNGYVKKVRGSNNKRVKDRNPQAIVSSDEKLSRNKLIEKKLKKYKKLYDDRKISKKIFLKKKKRLLERL